MNSADEKCFTGENLIFILGAPRSGTTWLQRLLASHPKIKTGPESYLFRYVANPLRFWRFDVANCGPEAGGGLGLPAYMTEPEFMRILRKFLDSLLELMLRDLPPGEFLLEKTPAHSVFASEIVQLLPKAKIIHIIRDPREVVSSLMAASKDWARAWAPRRADKATRVWLEHVQAVREIAGKVPPAQFLEVRYAQFFRDQPAGLRRIFDFLNLAWTDAEIAAAIKANSADELRKNKGTPIVLGGEHGKHAEKIAPPKNFVRKALPDSWKEDLTIWDRIQISMLLSRKMPDWKKFVNM